MMRHHLPLWIRDEVIIALTYFHRNAEKPLSTNKNEELSHILRSLPIIPESEKAASFRNVNGMRQQLSRFSYGLKKNEKTSVNSLFYEIEEEYRDDLASLYEISDAIVRCLPMLQQCTFGDPGEESIFEAGILLGHLHRNLERPFDKKISEKRCKVCGLEPSKIYNIRPNTQILQAHLLIPPTQYMPTMKISEKDIIVLCPTCHHIVHNMRPWPNRDAIKKIL